MGEAYTKDLSNPPDPSIFMRVYYESWLTGHLRALGTSNPPNQRVQAYEAGEDDPNSARVEIVAPKEVRDNSDRLDPAILADSEIQAELRRRVPELARDIEGVAVTAVDLDWDIEAASLTFILDGKTRQALASIRNKTLRALNAINPSDKNLLWTNHVPRLPAATIYHHPGSDTKEAIVRAWRSAQFLRGALMQRAVITSAEFPDSPDQLDMPEPPLVVPRGAGKLALVRTLPPQ